jgi:hypothetical protein
VFSSLAQPWYVPRPDHPCTIAYRPRLASQAAQQSQGIQTLLEAEKEAAKVVQQARQCTFCSVHASVNLIELMAYGYCGYECILVGIDRVQKLKDARAEASKEVEDYKKQKEQEYKTFESKVSDPSPLHLHFKLIYFIVSVHSTQGLRRTRSHW